MGPLAFITKNNPGDLKKALSSLEQRLPLGDTLHKIVISNYGDDIFSSDRNDLKIINLNSSLRNQWIQGLKTKFDPAMIDFCLQDNARIRNTGANRNNLLLFLSEEKFISFDDDVEFDFFKTQNVYHNPLGLKTFYFANNQELLIYLTNHASSVSLADCFSEFEKILCEKDVGIVSAGHYGDSGFSNCKGLLALDLSETTSLLQNKNQFQKASTSRIIWRSTNDKKSRMASVMMPMLAFNNKLNLPPFFPLGRNQDGFYPYILASCLDNVFIKQTSIAISHSPLNKRTYTVDSGVVNIRMNDLLILLFGSFLKAKQQDKSLVGYKAAADFILSIAQKKSDELAVDLKSLVGDFYSRRVQSLIEKDRALKDLNLPGYSQWSILQKSEVEALRKALNTADFYLPEECRAEGSLSSGLIQCQQWLFQYGELLAQWVDLKRCAHEYLPSDL